MAGQFRPTCAAFQAENRTKGDRLFIRSSFFSERKKRSTGALSEQLTFRLMLRPTTQRHHTFMKS